MGTSHSARASTRTRGIRPDSLRDLARLTLTAVIAAAIVLAPLPASAGRIITLAPWGNLSTPPTNLDAGAIYFAKLTPPPATPVVTAGGTTLSLAADRVDEATFALKLSYLIYRINLALFVADSAAATVPDLTISILSNSHLMTVDDILYFTPFLSNGDIRPGKKAVALFTNVSVENTGVFIKLKVLGYEGANAVRPNLPTNKQLAYEMLERTLNTWTLSATPDTSWGTPANLDATTITGDGFGIIRLFNDPALPSLEKIDVASVWTAGTIIGLMAGGAFLVATTVALGVALWPASIAAAATAAISTGAFAVGYGVSTLFAVGSAYGFIANLLGIKDRIEANKAEQQAKLEKTYGSAYAPFTAGDIGLIGDSAPANSWPVYDKLLMPLVNWSDAAEAGTTAAALSDLRIKQYAYAKKLANLIKKSHDPSTWTGPATANDLTALVTDYKAIMTALRTGGANGYGLLESKL